MTYQWTVSITWLYCTTDEKAFCLFTHRTAIIAITNSIPTDYLSKLFRWNNSQWLTNTTKNEVFIQRRASIWEEESWRWKNTQEISWQSSCELIFLLRLILQSTSAVHLSQFIFIWLIRLLLKKHPKQGLAIWTKRNTWFRLIWL